MDLFARQSHQGGTLRVPRSLSDAPERSGGGVRQFLLQQRPHQQTAVALHPDRSRHLPRLPGPLRQTPQALHQQSHAGPGLRPGARDPGAGRPQGRGEAPGPRGGPPLLRGLPAQSGEHPPHQHGGHDLGAVRAGPASHLRGGRADADPGGGVPGVRGGVHTAASGHGTADGAHQKRGSGAPAVDATEGRGAAGEGARDSGEGARAAGEGPGGSGEGAEDGKGRVAEAEVVRCGDEGVEGAEGGRGGGGCGGREEGGWSGTSTIFELMSARNLKMSLPAMWIVSIKRHTVVIVL
mmetsp:Transcript_22845/g.52357  ORF Transcript_22845/g.52357 Transcript_22845/m.52357 type:complete len:294 (-) Transcript_22845:103-984(-)